MKAGTRVYAWRETKEKATIRGVHTALPDGSLAVELQFDGDPDDDLYVYALDGLEEVEEN